MRAIPRPTFHFMVEVRARTNIIVQPEATVVSVHLKKESLTLHNYRTTQ